MYYEIETRSLSENILIKMEALKKARTQYRRLFSKACNDFEEKELDLSDENKLLKLKIIEEKALLMIENETKIRDQLSNTAITEKELEAEFDESEIYIDRWRNFEQKFRKLSVAEKDDSTSSVSSSNVDVSQKNTLLRYPKIQLPSFNGDIRNWLGFWGQFQKIDKDPSLDMHDKFSYLSQAMVRGSVADELIRSFPPGGDSYEKAINQLKSRFGKDELLIQVYVRDLLALVLQKEKNKNSLRVLYDLLETKLRALEILGVTRDKYASMIFPLIESSLPEDTLRAWERYRSNNRRFREDSVNNDQNLTIVEKSDLNSILDFLQDEVEAEERILLASQSFDSSKSRQTVKRENKSYGDKNVNNKWRFGNTSQVPTAADLFTSAHRQRPCIFCSNFHNSADCLKVRKLPLKEREILVERSHCCFLCLRSGHQVRQCNVKAGCLSCGKRHHILLCRNMQSKSSSSDKVVASEEKSEKDTALANISKSPNVMLQTLMVIIRGNGKRRRARAIIDSASQRSYILKDTARDMNYEVDGFEYLQHALFGGNNTGVCKHDVFKLFLTSVNGDYNCNFKVLSQPVICETKPPTTHEFCDQELSDFSVDVDDDHRAPIEILIGADVAGKLMTGGYKLLPSGLAAIETRLGWTIMGRTPTVTSSECLMLISMTNQDVTIADLWTLDSLGITDPSENKSKQELQEAAKTHFLNTVKVEEERFMVNLPWLENHRALPDNYELSLKRLHSTLKKLEADGLYQAYEKVFAEWLKEGVIEEVPAAERNMPCHYLPHRHVVKENSTTRIRPVFDASAKIKRSPSLNECLEKGPNLMELIPTVLTKFRLGKIGVIADIKKAFLQISISPNDKNFLRFLWMNVDKELKVYRHCRVVFGVTSSPFLLGAVIQYHLQTVLEESVYPKEIIEKLIDSFYVDNCVTSVETESELQSFIDVATSVMAKRKFDLRGWEHSNSTKPFTAPTNVLGLLWDKYSDTLRINLSSFKNFDEKVTKRIILASAHKIFDPLGVTCPVALFPKLILQRLWKENMSWDQEVDLETKKMYQKWRRDVIFLSTIEIPRWIRLGSEGQRHSLHVFCDASRSAYATVVFLRVERENSVHIQLIQAKARVSPCGRKETTVARLELLGATIAARLFSNIVKDLPVENVYCWTDSTTVLAWLRRDDTWGVFVQNRVEEILRLTPKDAWRFVPGIMNPADLPSRGCSARQLSESRWWEGPEWLYSPSHLWPMVEDATQEEEVNSEKKKRVVSSMLTVEVSTLLSSRTNNYKKIVNIVTWVKRFIYNCRNRPKKVGELTVEDIEEAEKTIIYLIQQEYFTSNNDKRLQTLDTFLDERIIRLKTTVLRREDLTEFRMPAILPGDHPIVKALVLEEHKKKGHAGVSHTLNSLRERFWILCGRRTVKSVIRSCIICKRYAAKNNKPPTAPPPADRVQDSNVFQVIGVDFAGPVILRDNSKSWICLFTCAVYRAVHLELVTSLSTETFLLAFHRFVARRGKPSIVYSDNGTNFTGSANIFASIDFDKIFTQAKEQRIIWKFIPPAAPWWGGWWERLVGMMKNVLKKTLGKASLNNEEMITVLCNCEAILNDRPLTSVTSDPDLSALTPADFLREIKNTTIPDIGTNTDPNFLRRRLRYIQSIREAFRARFRQEYLGALYTKKINNKFSPLKEGDIVLIGDDDKKKQSWPLGRIVEVFPGADSIIRRVKVRTQNGEFYRAAQKIYPLELSSSETIENELCSVKKKIKRVCVTPGDKEDIGELKAIPKNQVTRHGRSTKKPDKLDL